MEARNALLTPRNLALVGLIVACALSRLVPHPPNFSPIEATALFAGAYLGNRWLAVLVPLAAMALSDAIIGFHDGLPLVYACIATIAVAGSVVLRTKRSAPRIALTGFGSALFFFIVTNGAIWLTHGTQFCTSGPLECYVAALPFFQNQLAGVAFYSLLLFGGWALLERRVGAMRANPLTRRMGNRLSKIYTKTGDDGSTGLGDGTRVSKDSARVAAYGTVDELNSAIGMVLAQSVPETVRECLTSVQHELFDLGGELCIPGSALVDDADVTRLERQLDVFNEPLPPLKDFILPGGGLAAASCHLARTVCRRAEREVVTLSHHDAVRGEAVRYLNRLSDLLFVIARVLARFDGHGEVLWRHERRKRG